MKIKNMMHVMVHLSYVIQSLRPNAHAWCRGPQPSCQVALQQWLEKRWLVAVRLGPAHAGPTPPARSRQFDIVK